MHNCKVGFSAAITQFFSFMTESSVKVEVRQGSQLRLPNYKLPEWNVFMGLTFCITHKKKTGNHYRSVIRIKAGENAAWSSGGIWRRWGWKERKSKRSRKEDLIRFQHRLEMRSHGFSPLWLYYYYASVTFIRGKSEWNGVILNNHTDSNNYLNVIFNL